MIRRFKETATQNRVKKIQNREEDEIDEKIIRIREL
jgi:hypothetical protein